MVKELSVVGSFLATIGATLQILTFQIIFRGYSWMDLQAVLSPKNNFGGFGQPLPLMAVGLLYSGIFFIIISGFASKKKTYMIFGGFLIILGFLTKMISYINGLMFHGTFFIMNSVITTGVLFYFMGIIQNRRYNNVAIISCSFLLLIVIITGMIFGGFLLYFGDKSAAEEEQIIISNIVLQMVQGVIFTLHGWVFSFTKNVDYEIDVKDDLSIEDRSGAFTSYVPDEMKRKEKKRKVKKEDDDITFTF